MVLAHDAREGQTQAKRWGWLAATGLFSVAVLASGWTLATADEPKAKIVLEARAEGEKDGQPKIIVVEGKTVSSDKNVTVTVTKDPQQAEKVAALKAKIAAAVKAGKSDDVLKLIEELEKLLSPKVMTFEGKLAPVPPVPPKPPVPGVPAKPLAPLAPVPPGKVFVKPGEVEVRNWMFSADGAKSAIEALKNQLSQTKEVEAKKAIEAAIKALENVKPLVKPLEIRPGQFEISPEKLARMSIFEAPQQERFGLSVSEVPEVLADQLNIERSGAIISAVKPGSLAAEAGLRVHDIITQVGKSSIKNEKALVVEMSKLTPETQVELKILRKGKPATVTMSVPKPKESVQRYRLRASEAHKVRFDSMQVQVNGEIFQIAAKNADASYSIEGKLKNGQPSEMSIQVKVGEKVLKATSPEFLAEPHSTAVQSLLSNVTNN